MRLLLTILIASLFAAGCNSDPRGRREVALLRAEILDLEDKYYLLKSEHAEALAELNGIKGTSHPDDVVIGEGEIIYETPVYAPSPSQATPGVVPTPPNGNFQLEVVDPIQQPPVSPNSGELPPQSLNRTRGNPGRFRDQPISNRSTVSQVVINRRRSAGQDVDGVPGDEGINLLIQPLSQSGTPVLAAGELNVSISEPGTDGRDQPIGFWKFLPDETPLFFTADDANERGILLHLPWDQRTPTGDILNVRVSYRNGMASAFETTARIPIVPPQSDYSPDDPLVAGWSQSDPNWSSGQPTINSRNRVQAIPASSGSNRIQKPRWRPIR